MGGIELAFRLKEPLSESETEELRRREEQKFYYTSSSGDGGYLDSYNSLKQKGDMGRERYMDQIRSVDKRRNGMRREAMSDLGLMIAYVIISIVYVIIMVFIENYFASSGFLSGLYTMMNLFKYPVLFVLFVIMFPMTLGRFCKRFARYGIMTEMPVFKAFARSRNIISLKEERARCSRAVEEYDSFMNALYSDDTKDVYPGRVYHKDSDHMSPAQREVINRLEVLSEFPDFYSKSLDSLRDVSSPVWLYVGIIFLFVFLALIEVIVLAS